MSAGVPRRDSRVTIERWNSLYLVAHEHPDPEQVRRQMDALLRDRLPELCAQMLAQIIDADDPAVWLIRRLDANLTLDIGAAEERPGAEVWAARITTCLAQIVARGPDGESALRFEDRAAYLAQFAIDLAEGSAWGKWYYRAFETLRSLPAGAALREAFVREPADGEAALLRLAAGSRLPRVLNVLSEFEARAVLDACFPDNTGNRTLTHLRPALELLLSAWENAPPDPSPSGLATARNALRLLLAARRQHPGGSSGLLRAALEPLLGLAEILRQIAAPEALLRRLAHGDLPGAAQAAREGGAQTHLECLSFWTQLGSDPDLLAQVARQARTDLNEVTATFDGTQGRIRQFRTPYAGLFLLLPSLLETGLHDVLNAAPYFAPEGWDTGALLRFLLGAKCLGRSRRIPALFDPTLALFAGLESLPPFEIFQQMSAAATPEQNQTCLRILIERLAQRGMAGGRGLAAEIVNGLEAMPAVLLLRDVTHDAWLYAVPLEMGAEEAAAELAQGLSLIRDALGTDPECLLLGPGLEHLAESVSFAHPLPSEDAAFPTLEAVTDSLRPTLTRYLTRARPASEDLAYLTLLGATPRLVTDLRFDLTWSLVARAVMQSFARRLAGFDWSGLEYLYQNFLAGDGDVTETEEHISVQLPVCPLQIILRMAGVDGQTCSLPWHDALAVRLSLPEN